MVSTFWAALAVLTKGGHLTFWAALAMLTKGGHLTFWAAVAMFKKVSGKREFDGWLAA